MKAARLRWLAVVLLLAFAAACGKKGNPQAPLRPVPAAVSAFSIERVGTAVTLQFTVPQANVDGSTPPAVERIEVFGVTLNGDAAPPTPAQLLLPEHLVTSVAVRLNDDAQPGAPADARPAPGDVARFVETVTAARPDGPVGAMKYGPAVRYYAAVPTSGRRRGAISTIVPVHLTSQPEAPGDLKADYTEAALTLSWPPMAAGIRFVVEETTDAFARPKRVTPEPIEAASLAFPVQFGETRCFAVRAVDRRDLVALVGSPSMPVCVTMVDRFAPPAPTGLLAVPGDGGVELVWAASTAPDLAGYIVLRGDDANGTLQRLTPAPVAVTAYRDLTVRSGATYAYAVVAVDKATPANQSGESNRVSVTVRLPSVR